MSETKACPECDSVRVRTRHHGTTRTALDEKQYRCDDCQTSFDNPVKRERKRDCGIKPETILQRVAGE